MKIVCIIHLHKIIFFSVMSSIFNNLNELFLPNFDDNIRVKVILVILIVAYAWVDAKIKLKV